MIYGTTSKFLRVDLSTRSIEVEELSEDFYRLYPGGKALAGYILLNEMPPQTDPFAPENVLVIANGLCQRINSKKKHRLWPLNFR
jgi:aldehyde:ferredoxin oxidoreductase